ncbi:hypothetical protein Q5M87_03900 [Brachyspira innocens]|uniref:Lipoprotein n=1 Tax=Brachyspira innocens TaxID=13264 RepID=A0ABT8YXP6_9SPIR|nr:hypothetical protein [Brachyspira innocens]MDO6993144.1 hypothetical protein [Brachyspira innocens]MDO7020028.1 hypothetical protein [Brachyspira innocens]
MFFLRNKIVLSIILIYSINIYSITLTILPFTSENEEWINEYKVDDGIPRVLQDSLINTKMFEVTDYDLLVSYFSSYDIVLSYKSLVTNLQIASDFVKETFNSDYIITGEVLDFNLKKGGKDVANVKFRVNLLDINSLRTIKSFTDTGTYTLPNNSMVYSAEDALFNETALGRASDIALNKTALSISDFLGNPPLTGIITRIENNQIYINLGKKNNIKKGDEFNIYKIEKILEMPSSSQINIVTNISNSPKISTRTNQINRSYMSVRTNEKGDVWYTSEMLYKYRYYKNVENFIASAKVIETYENFAILESEYYDKIEPMMIVKVKD